MTIAGGALDDGQTPPARRGLLRVYLGAAPGVGKTYAMLGEGRRRASRGTDVVIGFVETYGRPLTQQAIGNLEVVPRTRVGYRGATFEEMDLDAVLARRPQVALVDELAHTNVPGCRNEKRWQDVEELLAAGIDVVTTLNIQHLESLNDVVERITGQRQRETVPDEVVRATEQVELIDMTPEALRRRLAHGNIYKPEKIDAALGNYFRVGNLAALRELALLWIADQVDDAIESYRGAHGIAEPWETRERVIVAVTGAPGNDALIRRAARIAQRAHGDLVGVHVHTGQGLAGPPSGLLEQHRSLLVDMGGEYREVAGDDVGGALVEFARAENATQLVLGASHRSRWAEFSHGSVINRVIRLSGPIDIHVISQDAERRGPGTLQGRPARPRASPLPPRRQAGGVVLALAGVPLLTAVLSQFRETVGLPTVLLLFLALVVATAAAGGTLAAVLAAVMAFLAANWYFTPPFHQWSVAEAENVLALAVFLGVAVAVSRFVAIAARRAAETARARSEALTLAGLAATMSADEPVPALLAHLQAAFGFRGVALLGRVAAGWEVRAASGDDAPIQPGDADVVEELSADCVLAVRGHRIAADDQRILKAFATQLALVLEQGRLRVEASRAGALAEANALRSALLQAISHDLRTPLASIKASVTSLRQDEVAWSAEESAEFLRTIDEESDRLTALIGTLLDMSRIQAGALHPALTSVALEEVVASALASLGPRASLVDAEVSEALPPVLADGTLLERALANVVDNAIRFTPAGGRVRIDAGAFSGHMVVRVIDQGPGIPPATRDQIFLPFQRIGDNHTGTGVGLGLAVARGFLSAMDATVEVDDTPGGGTTMVLRIPTVT